MGNFGLTLRARFEAIQEKTMKNFTDCVQSCFSDVPDVIAPQSHNKYHMDIRENWEYFFGETPKREAVNELIPDLTPSD